jgi:predicted ArsR family transcriptional regulator
VKFGGVSVAVTEADERTRDRVCEELLAHGPLTAGEVASTLGLGAAGVRRHLDALAEAGLVTVWTDPPPSGRGRGRPARRFVVTREGHDRMETAYDDVAAEALRFLERTAGRDAVRRFADERVAAAEARYRPVVDAAGKDLRRRAEALAGVLTSDGFAATSRPLPAGPAAGGSVAAGTQLCQGHCPVQHVAAQFPQLCEAETEAFSRLLGVHVQRLATLAQGDHVCTTYVPDTPGAYRPTTISFTDPDERTFR